jgi:hypothetical protein
MVPAHGCLHRWNILGEGSSLGVDACANGFRDIVRDKRNALRSIPLSFYRTALSSWSLGNIAVWLRSRGVAMEVDLLPDPVWKRAGIRAGVGRTQVHETRPGVMTFLSAAQSAFSLQIEGAS